MLNMERNSMGSAFQTNDEKVSLLCAMVINIYIKPSENLAGFEPMIIRLVRGRPTTRLLGLPWYE